MDENGENLMAELENAQSAIEIDESDRCPEIVVESKSQLDIQPALDAETSKSTMLENLESKKKELVGSWLLSSCAHKFPTFPFIFSIWVLLLVSWELYLQSAVEEKVKNIEKGWVLIQENALKQPSRGI